MADDTADRMRDWVGDATGRGIKTARHGPDRDAGMAAGQGPVTRGDQPGPAEDADERELIDRGKDDMAIDTDTPVDR